MKWESVDSAESVVENATGGGADGRLQLLCLVVLVLSYVLKNDPFFFKK